MMIEELAQVMGETPGRVTDAYPLLLISRRINHVMNSVGHHLAAGLGEDVLTPAFLHPQDLDRLQLTEGMLATVTSRHGEISVRLRADDNLRPGTVSVVHGFGGRLDGANTERKSAAAPAGCSVTRLTGMDDFDPVTGIPRLSAIPVRIAPHAATLARFIF